MIPRYAKNVFRRQIAQHFRLFSDDVGRSDEWLNNYGLLSNDKCGKLSNFEEWLVKSGVKYRDHVFINENTKNGQGRTCHAVGDIESDTPVVQIPLHCLINSSDWKNTAIGKIALESGVDDRDGNIYLSLALLQLWSEQKEANDSSNLFHGPYLDILPRRLPHIPLFWSANELLLLEGSPMLESIEARRKEIFDDFQTLQSLAKKSMTKDQVEDEDESKNTMLPAIKALESATAADFAIAEMTVCSRAFEVHGAGRGGRSTRCLVPLADMLNTALPHTCDVDFKVLNVKESIDGVEKDERKFVMHSLHSLRDGQQIFDSYGYKSNHRYLLNYGFSFVQNERFDGKCPNEVDVLIKTSSLSLDVEKHPCLSIWGDLALKVILSVPLGNDDAERHGQHLLALLRFLACSSEELDVLIRSHLRGIIGGENRERLTDMGTLLQRLLSTPHISTRNEEAAWGLFGSICSRALESYPTTSAQDWEMIVNATNEDEACKGNLLTGLYPTKFSNQWNALVHVHGEKRILKYWLERSKGSSK